MGRIRQVIVGALAALMVCGTSYAQYATSVLYNKSGATVSKYDIVIWDTSNDRSFKTTTTSRDTKVLGVVVDNSISNNTTGAISTGSAVVTVRVTGAVTRGDFLVASTTAGAAASGGTTNTTGAFGIALESGTSTNIKAYTFVAGQAAAGDLTLTGDLAVNGGDITSTATTFNLLNSTVTTLNIGGAGTTIGIGSTSGTLTLNNPTVVGSQTTVNLWNTTSTTVNFGGAATAINMLAASGTVTIGKTTGTVILALNGAAGGVRDFRFQSGGSNRWFFRCDGSTETGSGNTGSAFLIEARDDSGNFIDDPFKITRASGGDITITRPLVGAATQSCFNTTTTTLNIGGAATTLSMGAGAASTATLSFTSGINLNTGTIASNQTTVALLNTTATTINFGGAATTIAVGASTGTCTIANATATFSGTTAFNVAAPLKFTSTASPTSGGTGTTGQWTWDTNYIYVCTGTNTWKRVALTGGY